MDATSDHRYKMLINKVDNSNKNLLERIEKIKKDMIYKGKPPTDFEYLFDWKLKNLVNNDP